MFILPKENELLDEETEKEKDMTSDGKDKDMDKQEKEEKDIDTQEIILIQKYVLKVCPYVLQLLQTQMAENGTYYF